MRVWRITDKFKKRENQQSLSLLRTCVFHQLWPVCDSQCPRWPVILGWKLHHTVGTLLPRKWPPLCVHSVCACVYTHTRTHNLKHLLSGQETNIFNHTTNKKTFPNSQLEHSPLRTSQSLLITCQTKCCTWLIYQLLWLLQLPIRVASNVDWLAVE